MQPVTQRIFQGNASVVGFAVPAPVKFLSTGAFCRVPLATRWTIRSINVVNTSTSTPISFSMSIMPSTASASTPSAAAALVALSQPRALVWGATVQNGGVVWVLNTMAVMNAGEQLWIGASYTSTPQGGVPVMAELSFHVAGTQDIV